MSEQVLIIDDEKDTVDDILLALQMRDISCRGETDPQSAIESFRASPTDVVIVDYLLSAPITGVDVINQMQTIKPFTQFILISGRINRDLDERTLTEELRKVIKANQYIPKPIDLHRLVEAVQAALKTIESSSNNWKTIAEQYVNTSNVTPDEVRLLNEKIKDHILKAVDNVRKEE